MATWQTQAMQLSCVGKRFVDVLLCSILLVVLTPAFGLIALAIWLEDGRPILFSQTRWGMQGQPFRLVKFRTMVNGASALQDCLLHLNGAVPPLFKIESARDPRLTIVGRALRAYRLDELPQLWNVLRGEMSLVGPRPLVPDEASVLASCAHPRFYVPPGITGLWQINSAHARSLAAMSRLDLEYVTRRTLLFDLQIMARTVPFVVTRRGVT